MDGSQPQSIHGHQDAHPFAVATLAILGPLLFALIIGVLYLLNRQLLAQSVVPTVEASPAPSHVLEKYELQNAAERLAVCNDGSPGVYYLERGQAPNADKWIIYKETDGSCTDDASCAKRLEKEPMRVSSKDYPALMAQRGVLSSNELENPDYWNYNHVYIKYCSSDGWALDESREINGQTIQFRGKRIFQAVNEDLGIQADTPVSYLQ